MIFKFTIDFFSRNRNGYFKRIPFLIIPFLLLSISADMPPNQVIDKQYNTLMNQFNQHPSPSEEKIEEYFLQCMQGLFDFNRLAPQLLQEQWLKVSSKERELFISVLKKAFLRDMFENWKKYSSKGLPVLQLRRKDVEDSYATLEYSILGDKGSVNLSVSMIKYPDVSWKVTNIRANREDIRSNYFKYCRKTIDDFSFPYLLAELGDADYVNLEDFEGNTVGELPRDWTWRDRDNDKHKPYIIKEENGNKYLSAEDNGESVILGKVVGWDLRKYRYISFRWRAREIPKGGDERIGETNDSAAAIYITYKKKLGLIPESVKYVWSTTLPVGVATQRSGVGRPWNIVAESGSENVGEWRTYVFDAYESYKKTFGGDPPDSPIGVGILSDANSTDSKAYADYDDIRALRKANADSGVKQFMKGE